MKHPIRTLSVVPIVALALAACGGDATTATTAATTAPTTEATTTTVASDQAPVTVNVTADEYSFESDITTFQVGVPYHFVVTNVGKKAHEFMIVTPIEPGVMDMEAMDELAVADIEEDDLGAGVTATVDHTFTAEEAEQPLEMGCHIQGHYEDGMHLDITVTS